MTKELRIRRGDVELTIHFENKDDLEKNLADYEDIIKVIEKKFGSKITEKEKVRKDLEGICEFVDSELIFNKSPDSQVKKICLTLHAYGPKGTTLEEMTAATGISNPSRNVLSIAGYKKYFRKLARGKHVLSDVGISFVTNEILPELRRERKNGSA